MWSLSLLSLFAADADACGGPSDTRVVGWSADGSLALVRFEEQDDDGILHDLRLQVLDLTGGDRGRSWTILGPDDQGSASVRGARWKAAEPEIAAADIVVQPELAPLAEPAHQGAWTLPGKDYQLRVVDYSFDQSAGRRWELHAVRGERDVTVSVLYEDANSGMPFMLGKVFANPQGTHLVLTNTGSSFFKAYPVTVAAVEAALGS